MPITENVDAIRLAGGRPGHHYCTDFEQCKEGGGVAKGGDEIGGSGQTAFRTESRQRTASSSLPAAEQTTQLRGGTFFTETFHNKCYNKYCLVLELTVLTELRPLRSISTTTD